MIEKHQRISQAKVEKRQAAHRALLKRQSERELNGFYTNTMPVAMVLKQRFGHFGRQFDDETGFLVRMR